MAADIFLKIDGIKGESKDNKHKDEIEVMSWSWGESNSGSAARGGGMGSGKVDMQDISIAKYVDKASVKLIHACAKGEHIAKAELVCRKAGGDQKEYLKINLEDVMVTGYSTAGAGEVPTENISLNFGKITVEYFEQDNKGTMTSVGKAGWDIKANKAVA